MRAEFAALFMLAGSPELPPPTPATLDAATLERDVRILAAPELGGRAPRSAGSRRAREFIAAELRAAGARVFEDPVESSALGLRIGTNLVGVLPGATTPQECVYVIAHYDHWGRAGGRVQPGANDNASGVAVMLAIARRLGAARPARTVVFLAADNEEGALLPTFGGIKGSRDHARAPACERGAIKGGVAFDMLGGRFMDGLDGHLLLIGSESSAATYALSGALAGKASPPAARLGVYAIEPLGPLIPRSDYAALRDMGVPFVFATSGIPSFYHTPEDTPDKLDYGFMAAAGESLLGLVASMAASGFSAPYADGGRGVLDWRAEKAAASYLVSRARPARASPELSAAAARLEAAREPADLREAIADVTVTIMKLNGALKVREHLWRTH